MPHHLAVHHQYQLPLLLDNDFTLTHRMNLYCDNQGDRDMIQYMLLIGSFFGTFIINVLSESKGRKTALIVSSCAGLVGLVGRFLSNYSYFDRWLFQDLAADCSGTVHVRVQCLSDAASDLPLFVLMLLRWISSEINSRHQLLMVNFFILFRCITFVMIGVLYYVYNDWFGFLLYVSFIPMALTTIVSVFFIVEGPNYLYRKRMIDRCK
jgi:hypothetical protein